MHPTPDGSELTPVTKPQFDGTLVKALARAFRRRQLTETGAYGTVEEIAAAEKINASYVSRVLRLTLLAPDIVEAILDGPQAMEITPAVLMTPVPGAAGASAPEAIVSERVTYDSTNPRSKAGV